MSKNRMELWAEREVQIACERERNFFADNDGDHHRAEYGCACYESALKAYRSLMEDDHSGMSISITKNILNRLIEGKPLTPIEDTDDIWNDGYTYGDDDNVTHYQCKRMSGLFKKIDEDGTVKYSDVDRTLVCDLDDEHHTPWHNGFISSLIDEMYPITMPYYPDTKYEVYRRYYLTDEANGDHDTMCVEYVDIKRGCEVDHIAIDRFFKEENNSWVEITYAEFEKRVFAHFKRLHKLDPVHPALEEI